MRQILRGGVRDRSGASLLSIVDGMVAFLWCVGDVGVNAAATKPTVIAINKARVFILLCLYK